MRASSNLVRRVQLLQRRCMSSSNKYISEKYSSPYGSYPQRDIIGYGQHTPDPKWPGGANVAVQFVINYEEGGENCILHTDDTQSENLLSEIVGAAPYPGQRHMNMESLYEYGSRAGFWRLHRLFTERDMTCTVYAVSMALERNPEAAKAMIEADWEIASHGFRWIDYQNVDEETERKHIEASVEVQQRVTGSRPLGIYQGKPNKHTRRLIMEEGGFLYDADSYSDDLPYWVKAPQEGKHHLVIPYTLCNNDMVFVRPANFPDPDSFLRHLTATFDELYEEGEAGSPKMMSVGLHCRTVGLPGRSKALGQFLDYVKSKGQKAWVPRRIDICKHWYQHHHPNGPNPDFELPQ